MVALNVPLPKTSCETFVVSKETLSDVIKPCNLVCGHSPLSSLFARFHMKRRFKTKRKRQFLKIKLYDYIYLLFIYLFVLQLI